MSLENTEKLANEIVIKRKEYLLSKIKRMPASNFRASDIHECDRYMVYTILNWKDRSLYNEGLQAIFDRGNEEERIVQQDFMNIGYKFISQQTPFEIKNNKGEVMCRGSIDGKILYEGEAIPIEIKSMNMNTFNSINSIDDFQKKPLHRKYLRQMQLYLFGNNEEAGIFALSDLQGHYKLITVILDYGECEVILQRIEKNWKCVKNNEYPEPMFYQEKICGYCPFKHICIKTVTNTPANLIDNKELEEKLERREELKPLVAEYDDLDDEIKTPFKAIAGSEAIIGTSWRIKVDKQPDPRVNIKLLPDDIRKKYTEDKGKIIVKIIKL